MKPKKQKADPNHQLFQQRLEDMLDQRQRLYQLANVLPWERFEQEFEELYSDIGRPALPIRLMVGLLLLKQLENLSDERVCEQWSRDPYMQYFCGETFFQWKLPCEPSELVHFRERIGSWGMGRIFKATVDLHLDKVSNEDELVVDTTVQEANITYPTDSKLRRKCIERLWKLGDDVQVPWRRRYTFTVPKLLRTIRTRSNRLVKERRKAERKLKTIAGRLLRDIERHSCKVWQDLNREELEVIRPVLLQQRHDKNKIYSLHDPSVRCIAKGKVHKPYEFGRKASVAMLRDSGVIVSALSFADNLYDGDTLWETLTMGQVYSGKRYASALVDKGYRGESEIGGTEVLLPSQPKKKLSAYRKKKERKRYARRAAIEPVIGHLKSDHRMARCFLKGAKGSAMNLLLAASAWNLKKWMNDLLLALFEWIMGNLHPTSKGYNQSCQQPHMAS